MILNYWNQLVPRDREHAREIRLALREAQTREKEAAAEKAAKDAEQTKRDAQRDKEVTQGLGTFVNPAQQDPQWWAGALPSITIPNFKLP